MAEEKAKDPKLTVAQWEALWLAHAYEAEPSVGHSCLTHGMGVHKLAVTALERRGLMTVEPWYDEPWAEGFEESKLEVRWIAKLTPEGKRLFEARWALLEMELTDATEWVIDYNESESGHRQIYLLVHSGLPRSSKNMHPKHNGKEFDSLERAKWYALNAGLLKVAEGPAPTSAEERVPEGAKPLRHAETGKIIGYYAAGSFTYFE